MILSRNRLFDSFWKLQIAKPWQSCKLVTPTKEHAGSGLNGEVAGKIDPVTRWMEQCCHLLIWIEFKSKVDFFTSTVLCYSPCESFDIHPTCKERRRLQPPHAPILYSFRLLWILLISCSLYAEMIHTTLTPTPVMSGQGQHRREQRKEEKTPSVDRLNYKGVQYQCTAENKAPYSEK